MMDKKELQALKEKVLAEAKTMVGDVKQGVHDFFTLEIVVETPEGKVLGRSELDLWTGDQRYVLPSKDGSIDWALLDSLKDMNSESLALRKEILTGFANLLNIAKLASLV